MNSYLLVLTGFAETWLLLALDSDMVSSSSSESELRPPLFQNQKIGFTITIKTSASNSLN